MVHDHASPQLWGGIECTVNRVGDRYFDQIEYSGHFDRLADLDLLSDLGTKVVRYPVLWEHSERSGQLDFGWADARLARLRTLGIQPIAGLLHHGSGPLHTSLLDPNFSDKLANYAACVAERYPWLEAFTPVNEPLTTARFSGLYGHWYPHGRDDRSFVRALLNQCKGVCVAMQAVREVNSRAQLIQTEDIGFTRSTAALRYQADFENERRWLSLDLLAGRVDSSHPLRGYLERWGATSHDLGFFEDNPCPPDTLGLNYYVTSERFLDDRLSLYPPSMVGGNGRHAYVDVEAVRVCGEGLVGLTALLLEAHRRYRCPIAITEAHLGGAVDQQVRWLHSVWRAALAAAHRGVPVRAVTVWALFGAFGWDRLVTEPRGRYEAGAFELYEGSLRETELAAFVKLLARGALPTHLDSGWWEQSERLLYEPYFEKADAA